MSTHKAIEICEADNGYIVTKLDDFTTIGDRRRTVHFQIERGLAAAVEMLGIFGAGKVKVVIQIEDEGS